MWCRHYHTAKQLLWVGGTDNPLLRRCQCKEIEDEIMQKNSHKKLDHFSPTTSNLLVASAIAYHLSRSDSNDNHHRYQTPFYCVLITLCLIINTTNNTSKKNCIIELRSLYNDAHGCYHGATTA